jgi:hypothetical protein
MLLLVTSVLVLLTLLTGVLTKKLTEFKAAADTTTGVWGGALTIDVKSISLSSNNLRASTDITVAFMLPVTSNTVMAASDFVAM